MNLQNFNRDGRNYETERIRQISPSSKLIHLSNQQISFYVSKYGDPQDNTKDNENTKYFMSLIQPLLEENYQLKDTILNLTEALKLDKELLLQTLGQIVKETIFSTQSTISELLRILKESVDQDRGLIQTQQEEITVKNQKIDELYQIIKEKEEWKIIFIQEKNLEVEQRTIAFFEKMDYLKQNNEELEFQLNKEKQLLLKEQQLTEKLSQDISKKIDEIHKQQGQIGELQLQLSISERQIHQEKFENQKRLNEAISSLHREYHMQIEQLKIEQLSVVNDLKKQITDLQEEIKTIEITYTLSLDKNLQEIKTLQQILQESEKQIQIHKKQELTNLDNLSKTMMEKREKENKLKNLNQQLQQKEKESDDLKIKILQEKSKLEQCELKSTMQIEKYKTKYKEKTQVKIEKAKKELEQKVIQIETEKKKMSEDFKQQIIILDVQKTSLVKECKADNEKLRDEIEDLEFKIKDLDNMWDFKYAKLKMEYDRLKLEFNSKINNI